MPNHHVAMPRKAKKPVQSVTVVTKTEEAIAGSAPILSSSSGSRIASKGCRYQIDDHRRRNHPAELVVVEPDTGDRAHDRRKYDAVQDADTRLPADDAA